MNKRWATVQCGDFETREADGNLYIDGYFALFGSKYWLWEEGYETVDPGAFDLAADADVRALTNQCVEAIGQHCGSRDLSVDWHVAVGTPVTRLSGLHQCYAAVSHALAFRHLIPRQHVLTVDLLRQNRLRCMNRYSSSSYLQASAELSHRSHP